MSSREVETDADAVGTDADSIPTDADGVGTDTGAVGTDTNTDESGGLKSLLARLVPSGVLPGVPFSAKRFGVAVLLITAGIVAGGWIPLVGAITQYVGLFLAAFLLGATRTAGYLEAGSAGAVGAGLSTLLGLLSTGTFVIGLDVLQRYGLAVAGVGVSVGLLVAVTGVYFGRDLRAGLTRSV